MRNISYLTLDLTGGNSIGWSAVKISGDTMETMGMQPPANKIASQSVVKDDLKLSTNSQKLRDAWVPDSMKTHIFDPDWLLGKKFFGSQALCDFPAVGCEPPGTPHCQHCVDRVVVAGHYIENDTWSTIISGTLGYTVGTGCAAGGPLVVGFCGTTATLVLNRLFTWVPGYSYCNRWETYVGQCPVSFVPNLNPIMVGDRQRRFYETNASVGKVLA